MRMNRREWLLTTIVVLVMVFELGRWSGSGAALAAALHANVPDKKGLIHACYATTGGSVRVIDPKTSCRPAETRFSWYQGEAYTRAVKDVSLATNFTCVSSTQFAGYCVLVTFPVAQQPVHMTYMCESQAGVWQYPGPAGDPNSPSFLCYGDLLAWSAGHVYLLHNPAVPLDQTRHIRVEALYPSH